MMGVIITILIARNKQLDSLGYTTGVMNARVLRDKFTESGDLMDEDFTQESFGNLLTRKLEECSLDFIKSIKKGGVVSPIAIIDKNGWQIHEGHHRLAVALQYNLDVPYVLLDSEEEVYNLYTIFGLDYHSGHDSERVIL